MKRYIWCVVAALLLGSTLSPVKGQESDGGKNFVKFNMGTLLGGKFSFEYERLLTKRISVGTAVSFRPDKGLPFREKVMEYVDDENVQLILADMTSSNFSVTPEVRFYTSSKGGGRGFYVAPYLKYASYNAKMPYEFEVDNESQGTSYTKEIDLNADVTSFTAGLSFGVNFKLAKNLHLDWRIIGPGYGISKGDVLGAASLDADEQAGLREGFQELQYDLENFPVPLEIDYEVDGNGATINILKSPWASIRSGLLISYRF